MSLLIKKKFIRIPGGSNPGLPGKRQTIDPLHCQDFFIDWKKNKIFHHSTITIHILAGKIQNCLAFRADPKTSDLDTLIGL